MLNRQTIFALALICGGCAHSDVLPPFPTDWPLEGVEIPHPADVPSGHLAEPMVVPGDAELVSPPCDIPGALPGVVPALPAGPLMPTNPIFVPAINPDAAWESIVNVVDDYFRIATEERVQVIGNVLTEGRLETYPQVGATILEPHRLDSVGPFNRALATYQTIRRIGLVRVVPLEGGYEIECIVETQMEDLPRPEHATAGSATLRADTSVDEAEDVLLRQQPEGIWYPIGRDVALEQQILSEIRGCLDVAPPGVVY
jgi:hypothetical protein